MANEKNKKFKNIAFYGLVAVSLVVIGYFMLKPNKDTNRESIQTASTSTLKQTENSANQETVSQAADSTISQAQKDKDISSQDSNKVSSEPTENSQTQTTKTSGDSGKNAGQAKTSETTKQNSQLNAPASKQNAEDTVKSDNIAIRIAKNEVSSTAKFYPYKLDGVSMEVMAVKASDGTIRTALNTCQVCYDSGRGYYEQVGDNLVCQNCKNRFNVDQVEKVKGGCNPVPVLEENKQVSGDYITISKDFMESQKKYFSNWKKE